MTIYSSTYSYNSHKLSGDLREYKQKQKKISIYPYPTYLHTYSHKAVG